MNLKFRLEHDSFGELLVPFDALYGAQTQRAVENFPISGIRFPRRFIQALGLIKWAAAGANEDLGLLELPDLVGRRRRIDHAQLVQVEGHEED